MRECVCGHDFDDHESHGESLPLCVFCTCIGPKEIPEWIRKLPKR